MNNGECLLDKGIMTNKGTIIKKHLSQKKERKKETPITVAGTQY